jgi:1-acyl-sn-glycerol-3-phosphate acyltransferase
LNKGYPGIVLLAIRSGVPILPVVFYGNENFGHNIKNLRRTRMVIKVGEQFHVNFGTERMTKELREEVTTEIMYQIAKLLPPENRGVYADLPNASTKHLVFSASNLN